MNFREKISMFLFSVGALISIFSAVFPVVASVREDWPVIIMSIGLLIAFFNISKEEERDFLTKGLVFVLGVWLIRPVTSNYVYLIQIMDMFYNFTLLFLPALILISLKSLVTIASEQSSLEAKKTINLDDDSKFYKIWNLILLVSVAITLILLVFELFFNTAPFQNIIEPTYTVITIVFIIDVMLLAAKSPTWTYFFKHHFLDIIAAIPNIGFFNIAKLFRVGRIIKVIRSATKLQKTMVATKTLKYFSQQSGFNKLLDVELEEEESKKKKKSKKSTKKKSKK